MSINTEKIDYKLIYLIRNPNPAKMEPNKNLDNLIINLNLKLLDSPVKNFLLNYGIVVVK